MRLTVHGPNQVSIDCGNVMIFFSYETAVACRIGDEVCYVTDQRHSKTTIRHINAWAPRESTVRITKPQAWFDAISLEAGLPPR